MILVASVSQAETRTKIAVIDTGINAELLSKKYMCKDSTKNFTKYSEFDNHGHGSHIAHIIGSRIDSRKYCIKAYKVWHKGSKNPLLNSTNALKNIVKDKSIKYVNISMSGDAYSSREFYYLRKLALNGVKVSVAAGNDSKELKWDKCNIYPACYRRDIPINFDVVSASDTEASNTGFFTKKEKGKNIISYGGSMSGSSQATAIHTSKLINGESK